MAMNTFTAITDLNHGVHMNRIGRLFAQNDKAAHTFNVTVLDNGAAADLSGYSAFGYFIRGDDALVTVTGSVSSNVVSLTLPSACYEVPGHFSLIIKVSSGQSTSSASTVTAVFWGDGTITRSDSDVIVDPSHVVPSLSELLAQIAAMEAATAAAVAAAARTENMTVSASTASGSTPTATITIFNDHYNIAFGLVKGEKGDTGDTGNGINEASSTVAYQASGSGSVIPTGTWQTTPPTLSAGQYLWTRVILTYTSGNTQTCYSVGYKGADGNNSSPFSGATASTAGTTGWVPAPSAGDQEKVLKGGGSWGTLDASAVATGTFAASQIPGLDASKIISGTFDAARIPSQCVKLWDSATDTLQQDTYAVLKRNGQACSAFEFKTLYIVTYVSGMSFCSAVAPLSVSGKPAMVHSAVLNFGADAIVLVSQNIQIMDGAQVQNSILSFGSLRSVNADGSAISLTSSLVVIYGLP